MSEDLLGCQARGRNGRAPISKRVRYINIEVLDVDNVPDWWEVEYFGSLTNTLDVDSDGDGVVNSNEYL